MGGPPYSCPRPPKEVVHDKDQDPYSHRPGADHRADGTGADRPDVQRPGRRSPATAGRAGLLRSRRQGDPGGRQRRRDHEGRRGRRRRGPHVRSAGQADGRVHEALRRALRPAGPAGQAAGQAASGPQGPGRRHRLHRRRQGHDRDQLPRRRQGRLDHRDHGGRHQAAGQADGRRREDRSRRAQGRERQAAAVRHVRRRLARCASARPSWRSATRSAWAAP